VADRKQKRVLFYYLSAFSYTGGIEKFNRCFIKALENIEGDLVAASVVSVYDGFADKNYLSTIPFAGFNKKKARSLAFVLRHARSFDVIVLGHINLVVAGWLIKLLNPSCRLIFIAHGIEVWKKLNVFQQRLLSMATILAVSHYTRNQMVLVNKIHHSRIVLFPNSIDPFFRIPEVFEKKQYLLERYSMQTNQPVLFTLSRLQTSERAKGYDLIISLLPDIIKHFPNIVYIVAGGYDAPEKKRIEKLITFHGVKDHVIITGFVKDVEIPDHYMLADIFIMPSSKEGFGIVFLEALVCGTHPIGGNRDGSADALGNGLFGTMVDPSNKTEIVNNVIDLLRQPGSESMRLSRQLQVTQRFNLNAFEDRLKNILLN